MKIFDSHFHLIDKVYKSDNFTPPIFQIDDYKKFLKGYNFIGGALIAGSWEGFSYQNILKSLSLLGPNYVGIIQVKTDITDEEIKYLNTQNIRGIRFNFYRNIAQSINELIDLSQRVYDIAKWHVELYIDAKDLDKYYSELLLVPKFSIDHLGMSNHNLDILLKLVENGAKVKATGFGRVSLNIVNVIKEIKQINPNALMFGTDLPSTRAKRPYTHNDMTLLSNLLNQEEQELVFYKNACSFYNVI